MKNRILSTVLFATALITLAVACMQPTTNQPANTSAPGTTTASLPPELKPGLESISSDTILAAHKSAFVGRIRRAWAGHKG